MIDATSGSSNNEFSILNINREITASDAAELKKTIDTLKEALAIHPELSSYVHMLEGYEAQVNTAMQSGSINVNLIKGIEDFAGKLLASPTFNQDADLSTDLKALGSTASGLFDALLSKGGADQLIKDLYGSDPTIYNQAVKILLFMLDRSDVLKEINMQKMSEMKHIQSQMDVCNNYLSEVATLKNKDDDDAKTCPPEIVAFLKANGALPDDMRTTNMKGYDWDVVTKSLEQVQQHLMNDSQSLMTEMKLSQDDVQVALDTAKTSLSQYFNTENTIWRYSGNN